MNKKHGIFFVFYKKYLTLQAEYKYLLRDVAYQAQSQYH